MAGKLDQVPVPDMADSVWASIGVQLDAEGDAPDQGSDVPGQGGGVPGKGWYGFFGVVVVIATLWWYYDQKVAPVVKSPVPAAAPAPVVDTINNIKKNDIPATPVGVKKDTVVLHKALENIIRPDSAGSQQTLPPVEVDSSSLYKNWVPVPFFDSLSIKPRGRKPRGVKGITSDDYKISAGKNPNKQRE